jgi:DNA mismatch endonuclease, patch repair protein
MNNLANKQRSVVMATNKSKNTRPEVNLRSALFAKGYRFKIHVSELPGKPDIVMPKYKAVINVQGCFWHNHGCHLSSIPKTRTSYWLGILEKTKQRDFENRMKLKTLGWRVFDVWECTLKKKNIQKTFENLEQLITGMICAA